MNQRLDRRALSPAAVVLAAVGVVHLAGCTGQASDADSAIDVDIDVLASEVEENLRVSAELDALIGRLEYECVTSLGVDMPAPPASPEPTDLRLSGLDVLIGPSFLRPDPTAAASLGYESAWPQLFAEQSGQYEQFIPPDLQGQIDTALYGVEAAAALAADQLPEQIPGFDRAEVPGIGGIVEWPTEGCAGEVFRRVFGAQPSDFLIHRERATATLGIPLFEDDRYALAEREWVACMNDSGHHEVAAFTDGMRFVLESRGTYNDDYDAFFEAQRELAVADATCAEELGTNNVMRAIFTDLFIDHHSRYEVETFSFQEQAREALLRAQEVLEEGF
jgi:hypothetical protein